MREDMAHILVERPRSYRGSYARRAPGYPRGKLAPKRSGLEDAPTREKIGALYRTRALNENLAPLRRYLRSQVGRPWSKVHSEICARIDSSSAVQKHILQHLSDFVTTVTWKSTDGIVGADRYGGVQPVESRWYHRFYVCPSTGLLRAASVSKRRGAPPDPDVQRIDDWYELRRIAGVWYEVEYAMVRSLPCWDVVARRWIETGRYATKKRQLSRREITARRLRD